MHPRNIEKHTGTQGELARTEACAQNAAVPPIQPPLELAGGRYVVTGELGHGGQADTLEAVDKREGKLVAIKRFRVKGARSWKDVELAEREARVLASLNHPAMPRYVDHFEVEGNLYLVMQRIEGESLAALRKGGRRFSQSEVWRFIHELGELLDYLHSSAPPVIHRDIKPGNVIRTLDGSFVVVDFGAVRDCLKPEGGSTVVGTFGYMAPEQFMGRAVPASDVYAVGVTAMALLTGREPETLPHKGLSLDVEQALQGIADKRLIRLIEHMVEPDPDRRATRIEKRQDQDRRTAEPLPFAFDGAQHPAQEWSRKAEKRAERWARKAEKRAERWASHVDKQAHRWARHAMRRRGPPMLVPLMVLISLLSIGGQIGLGFIIIFVRILAQLTRHPIPDLERALEKARLRWPELLEHSRNSLESYVNDATQSFSSSPPAARGPRVTSTVCDPPKPTDFRGRHPQGDPDDEEGPELSPQTEARSKRGGSSFL